MPRTTCYFVGPSLNGCLPEPLPGEVWFPPAAQGDILDAFLRRNPKQIVLIDGTFRENLSVWVKEIVYVMSKGCKFIGAASMGALRAAELWRYGAIGVGKIFEMYKSGEVQDDAYVMVEYDPDTNRILREPPCGMEQKRLDAIAAVEFARKNKVKPQILFDRQKIEPYLIPVLDRVLEERTLLIA
jgi:hypothetical protein